jgi:hypothetical protein
MRSKAQATGHTERFASFTTPPLRGRRFPDHLTHSQSLAIYKRVLAVCKCSRIAGRYTVASLDQHPSIMALRSRTRSPAAGPVTAEELRRLCLEAGVDDVGFVRIDRPEIASEKKAVLQVFPAAKVLVSVVCRMNREPIRSPPDPLPIWNSIARVTTSTMSPGKSCAGSKTEGSGP